MHFRQLLEAKKKKEWDPLEWLISGEAEKEEKEYKLPKNQKKRAAKIKSRTAKYRNNIKKLEKEISKLKADIKKREAKVYKKSRGSVDTKDEFGQYGGSISIGNLNELRRKKAIRNIQYTIVTSEEEILNLSQKIMDTMEEIEGWKGGDNPNLKALVKKYYIDPEEMYKKKLKLNQRKKPFERWARNKG